MTKSWENFFKWLHAGDEQKREIVFELLTERKYKIGVFIFLDQEDDTYHTFVDRTVDHPKLGLCEERTPEQVKYHYGLKELIKNIVETCFCEMQGSLSDDEIVDFIARQLDKINGQLFIRGQE